MDSCTHVHMDTHVHIYAKIALQLCCVLFAYMQACAITFIHLRAGLYADAVHAACRQGDITLAKAVASEAPDEETGLGTGEGGACTVSPCGSRRRLWLAVAQHVVQQQVRAPLSCTVLVLCHAI